MYQSLNQNFFLCIVIGDTDLYDVFIVIESIFISSRQTVWQYESRHIGSLVLHSIIHFVVSGHSFYDKCISTSLIFFFRKFLFFIFFPITFRLEIFRTKKYFGPKFFCDCTASECNFVWKECNYLVIFVHWMIRILTKGFSPI